MEGHPASALPLGRFRARTMALGLMVGGAALVGALLLSRADAQGAARLASAYLLAAAFFLSISLGSLFLVMIMHVTRTGWGIVVRRPAEVLGASFPLLALLLIPALLAGRKLYPWMTPALGDKLLAHKAAYLNTSAFLIRLAIYWAIWSALGWFFLRNSTRQDATGNPRLTVKMERWSAPGLVLFALSVNFASFDLFMSLDPYWYSTIYGVYFFAGSVIAALAGVIVILRLLQKGKLAQEVTVEHYHDLGKLLFAFVFFWGYIAFSQYMLQWYANMPEETQWFRRRGATTVARDINAYSVLILALLFLHFAVPFVALLSRRAKRHLPTLTFWALWMLVMHAVDLFWLIRPDLRTSDAAGHVAGNPTFVPFAGVDVALTALCLAGVGGLYVAGAAWRAGSYSVVPARDPRIAESLAHHQM